MGREKQTEGGGERGGERKTDRGGGGGALKAVMAREREGGQTGKERKRETHTQRKGLTETKSQVEVSKSTRVHATFSTKSLQVSHISLACSSLLHGRSPSARQQTGRGIEDAGSHYTRQTVRRRDSEGTGRKGKEQWRLGKYI